MLREPWPVKLFYMFACILLIVGFVMAYYMPNINNIIYDIITLAIIFIAICINFLVVLGNWIRPSNSIVNFNDMVRKELYKFLKKQNDSVYHERGMEWYVTQGHFWMELRLSTNSNVKTRTIVNTETDLQTGLTVGDQIHTQITFQNNETDQDL